jgi:hypothetical protein
MLDAAAPRECEAAGIDPEAGISPGAKIKQVASENPPYLIG